MPSATWHLQNYSNIKHRAMSRPKHLSAESAHASLLHKQQANNQLLLI
jgi:hypothetical protein